MIWRYRVTLGFLLVGILVVSAPRTTLAQTPQKPQAAQTPSPSLKRAQQLNAEANELIGKGQYKEALDRKSVV